jgi:hypothetical protein
MLVVVAVVVVIQNYKGVLDAVISTGKTNPTWLASSSPDPKKEGLG